MTIRDCHDKGRVWGTQQEPHASTGSVGQFNREIPMLSAVVHTIYVQLSRQVSSVVCHSNRNWEHLNWGRCGASGTDVPRSQPVRSSIGPDGLLGSGVSWQSRGQPVRYQKPIQHPLQEGPELEVSHCKARSAVCGAAPSQQRRAGGKGCLILVRRGPVDGDRTVIVQCNRCQNCGRTATMAPAGRETPTAHAAARHVTGYTGWARKPP